MYIYYNKNVGLSNRKNVTPHTPTTHSRNIPRLRYVINTDSNMAVRSAVSTEKEPNDTFRFKTTCRSARSAALLSGDTLGYRRQVR